MRVFTNNSPITHFTSLLRQEVRGQRSGATSWTGVVLHPNAKQSYWRGFFFFSFFFSQTNTCVVSSESNTIYQSTLPTMQLGRWCPVCNISWYLTENQRPTRVLVLTSVLKLLSCRARASVRSSGGQDNFNHATINAHYRRIGTRLFHFSDFMLLSRAHSGLFLCPYLIGWPRFDLLSTKDDLLELELAPKSTQINKDLEADETEHAAKPQYNSTGFSLNRHDMPFVLNVSYLRTYVFNKSISNIKIFQSIVSKCEIQDRDNKIRTFQKKKKKVKKMTKTNCIRKVM